MEFKHSSISDGILDRMSDQEYIEHLEQGLELVDRRVEKFIEEYQTMIGKDNYSLPDLMRLVNRNIPLIALQDIKS